MNSMYTIDTYFSSTALITGGVELFLRYDARPVAYCLSLTNLSDLEDKLHDAQAAGQVCSHLSSLEKELYSGFSYEKRRKEWLGGRLAAKYAALALLDRKQPTDNLADLAVLPQENGSPAVHSSLAPAEKLPMLSISHSHNFAVAMAAATQPCGVDIQRISDKTQRVADRFCVDEERGILQDCLPQLKENEQLTLLWAAKEALKKSLLHDQPVIFQGVVLLSIEAGQFIDLCLLLPGDKAQTAIVTVVQLENYMLAHTVAGTDNA